MAKQDLFKESKEWFKQKEVTHGFCNWEFFHSNFKLECWNMEHPKTKNIEPVIVQIWARGGGYTIYRNN